MKALGLYVHIPFCAHKCAYCDFYSLAGCPNETVERYLTALFAHMEEYSAQTVGYAVSTIFLGGGTPTLLSEQQLKRVLKKIRASFRITPNCEVTIEANPGTVDRHKFRALKRLGVNRLSLGAQSFEDDNLKVCGRIHTSADVFLAVKQAREAGFDNINLDLIYGLPGQTLQHVLENVNTAIALNAEHVSLYGLSIEEGTPFARDASKLLFPDEDLVCEMFDASCKLLAAAGYNHYEISNFAKHGKLCRHNLRYWNCDEYLGLGPGAHSDFCGKRFNFRKDLKLYLDTLAPLEGKEHPTPAQSLVEKIIEIPANARIAEYVMLRMRLSEGVNTEKFYRRFGRDFESIYLERIMPYLASGHIIRTPRGYAFSPKGMFVSNFILARVVDFDMAVPGLT